MAAVAQFPNSQIQRLSRAVGVRTHMGMTYKGTPSLGPMSYGVSKLYTGRGIHPFVARQQYNRS